MSTLRSRTAACLALAMLVLLVACGGGDETTEETAAPTATTAPVEVPTNTDTPEPTQPPAAGGEQPTPTETAAETAPTESATAASEGTESEVPFDVPIMEGATDVLIQYDVGSVTYLMEDTAIEEVFEFYETTMPEQGWEAKTSSAIGMMGTLVFETEEARVSISLQANEIAETVVVRLFILEK